MWKIQVALFVVLITIALGMPVPEGDNKLDKATKNDVILNLVTPKSSNKERIQEVSKVSVTSSGTSGINVNPAAVADDAEEPQGIVPRTGGMFARFIDDVFQIPITVLQSVTKLLTNPFTQKYEASSA